MAADIDADLAQLEGALTLLIDLLRQHRQDRWANWLARDAVRIEAGERFGLDHLISAFGGMGSLNDVILEPRNRDDIGTGDLVAISERLHQLREQIYAVATRITRILDRETI